MPDLPRTGSDRNLLVGILAVQMDFISRDALLNGMNAWILQKSRPLGEILLEQGSMQQDEYVLLEALVRKHLEKHDNDPQKSLAALSSLGPVRPALEQIQDGDVNASLAHASLANEPAPGTRLSGSSVPENDRWQTVGGNSSAGMPTSSGLRFRILRPHLRGGIGQVSVALDEELQREVALKELQEKHADNPDYRGRFLLEGEITGGLEHPCIVPVYGLGQYADGRPFYAMRFIRGKSLLEAIERYHRDTARSEGATLELRQLLGRFLDVCNAVAYAHSRGVLHRDLKPGNIMLGQYGETLVVDWGLAKVLGPGEETAASGERPLQPASDNGSTPTQMGMAIGTPQYMSPEQAAGRLDQLGTASDVYSLGATLYALLTGRPPYEGSDVGEILIQVQRGELIPPRQIRRDLPAALEAITLKAMARQPADRHVSARALADDVERWLADEPTSVASSEPWGERYSRWMRRHRTLVTAAAVLLTTAVVALTVGFLLVNSAREDANDNARKEATARRQEAAARKAAELAETAADDARKLAVRKARDEETARIQAQRSYGEARLAAYASRLAQAEAEWIAGNSLRSESILHDCPWDLRGQEWNYVRRLSSGSLLTLVGHTDNITGVTYSRDGSRLASADGRSLRLWDAASGKELLNVKAEASMLAFSPDGKQLLSYGNNYRNRPFEGEVRLFDAATGGLLRVLSGHQQTMQGVAWSPDGKQLASCGGTEGQRPWKPGEVFLWDAETGKKLLSLTGHTGPVYSVDFSPDSKKLVTASADGTS